MAQPPRKKSTRQSKADVGSGVSSSSMPGKFQPEVSEQPAVNPLGIQVFISYSRKDINFAKELFRRLRALGFDIWIDWEGIPVSAEWQQEIQKSILASHRFLFVISPDSVQSQECMQELKIAEAGNKPIIPVLIIETDPATTPPEIRALNWLFMRDPDELTANLPKLSEALRSSWKTTTIDFAQNDRPTGRDQLDYQAYARAFAQVLASPHTKPPLTIGLYASWGMGKSFLMNKIKEELRAKERGSKTGTQTELKFHFIDFNAWEFSTSDNLWAGLITSLYGQVEKAYKPWQITRFRWTKRFRKNLRKTFGWGSIFTLLGVALALFLDTGAIDQAADIFSNLKNVFGTAFLSGSTLAALLAFLRAIRDLLNSTAPRSKELQSMVSRKDFSAQIGFMDEIKAEISDMLTLIREIERGKREVRFVLFVDDLDRCPPAKAVEVLEAILLLLSYQEGEAPFFIFLAIDARVIVKAIEVHYGKMLSEAGISGYEFLDKVVQIPFRIPSAGPDVMKKFVNSLLWQSDEARAEAEERRARFANLENPAPTDSAPAQASTQADVADPITELISEEPFGEHEQAALETYSPFITSNPRRVKRIVNIYRIARYLLNTSGLTADLALQKLLKWVVVSEEWPFRTAWMMQKIEDDYQMGTGISKTPNAKLSEIYKKVKGHVKDERARSLLALDSDPESFDKFITLEPDITAQDIHEILRPLTFNLNPAMRNEVLRAAAVNNLQQ